LAIVSLALAACSPSSTPPQTAAATPAPAALPADVLSQGQSIYEQLCATCHYDGKGSDKAPVLAGSAALKSQDNVINGILHGRKGNFKINGMQFEMPPQDSLSNEDVAAVVTYVRHTFGSVDQLTTPADVAKLR
jgi:mono/diheme cytochrome c family protein